MIGRIAWDVLWGAVLTAYAACGVLFIAGVIELIRRNS